MTYRSGVFNCDTCSDYFDTEEQDFTTALGLARKEGWRTYKGPDGHFAHSCPSCTQDFAKGDGR